MMGGVIMAFMSVADEGDSTCYQGERRVRRSGPAIGVIWSEGARPLSVLSAQTKISVL